MQNKSFGKNIMQGIRLRMGKIFHNPYRIVNIGPFKKIYYKHLNPGKVRTHRLFGKEISYYSPTELLHGLKEIFVDEIYKQDLPPRPYIIDCGANIGLSIIYMKRLYPDAEIVAFEPDEENFKLLEKNIRSFGLDQVDARKEAVWIEDKMLGFSGKHSTESRLVADNTIGSEMVKAIRLKNTIHKKIDFLKIDIEGAEYKVLLDLQGKLQLVKNLFLEYHGNFNQNGELNEILIFLVNNGFRYYIKEAASVYKTPFFRKEGNSYPYDIQLNIFCFR
ncbi:MAG TPA: FkbM family methyltransferase [Puia sp.]